MPILFQWLQNEKKLVTFMKRRLEVIFTVLLLFVILSIISILFGRLEYPIDSLSSLGVTNCEFKLCVLGVHYGTQWNEAKAKLINYPNSAEEKNSSITIKQKGYEVYFWTLLDGTTNIVIRSNYTFHLLTLGELIMNFNEPCSMTLTDEALYFEYPQFAAGVLLKTSPEIMSSTVLTPISQITDVVFLASQGACKTPVTFPSSQNIFFQWCGFKSIGQYMQHCKRK